MNKIRMQLAFDVDFPQAVAMITDQDSDMPSILRIIARGKFNEVTDFHCLLVVHVVGPQSLMTFKGDKGLALHHHLLNGIPARGAERDLLRSSRKPLASLAQGSRHVRRGGIAAARVGQGKVVLFNDADGVHDCQSPLVADVYWTLWSARSFKESCQGDVKRRVQREKAPAGLAGSAR